MRAEWMTYHLCFLCALDSSSPECDEHECLWWQSCEEDHKLEDDFEWECWWDAQFKLQQCWEVLDHIETEQASTIMMRAWGWMQTRLLYCSCSWCYPCWGCCCCCGCCCCHQCCWMLAVLLVLQLLVFPLSLVPLPPLLLLPPATPLVHLPPLSPLFICPCPCPSPSPSFISPLTCISLVVHGSSLIVPV